MVTNVLNLNKLLFVEQRNVIAVWEINWFKKIKLKNVTEILKYCSENKVNPLINVYKIQHATCSI